MSADTTTKQFKKQLPRNLIMKAASFGTSVLVGLWLVPYLIDHLGVAAYGMVPLAAIFTQYVGLIANSIKMPVARFITLAYRGEDEDSLVIFNTAFFTYLGLAILQIPVCVLAYSYVDAIIDIPESLHRDVEVLLACSFATYLLTFVGGVFEVATFANNRVDVDEGIKTSRLVLKVALLLILFSAFEPALRYVGFVELLVGLFVLGCKIFAWLRYTPELRIRYSSFRLGKVVPIAGMAGWILVSNLGSLLFLRLNLWLANRFISPEAGGYYGALMQWEALLRSSAAMAGVVIAPMVVIYYSQKQYDDAARVGVLGVKFLTGVLSVPCALIAGFSPHILSAWLGAEYVFLWPVLSAMVCLLFLNCGVVPIFQLQNAYNKVKVPALVSMLSGVGNVLLCYVLITRYDFGIMGMVVVTVAVLTLKNFIFSLWYASRITRMSISSFFAPVVSGVLINLVALILSWGCRSFIAFDNTLGFLTASALIAVASYTAFALVFIDSKERALFVGILRRSRSNLASST